MDKKENLHKGHRQRIIKKYMENGIDSLEDHEALEILLFLAFSRQNTNDISHRLIDKFGSLEKVFDADYNDLLLVNGIGSTAATLIKFTRDFADRLYREKPEKIALINHKAMSEHCYNLLKFADTEMVYILFLDSRLRLIGERLISTGTDSFVRIDMRDVVDNVIRSKCSNIVITHNHPSGETLPSSDDISTTRQLVQFFRKIGIEVVDHIIVNESGARSIRNSGMMMDIWF